MTIPTRVQRSRRHKLPPGAVYVGRPTRWGNPFTVADHGQAEAVALFRSHLLGNAELLAAACTALRGKTLACWCRPDQPCHADVLLEAVNPTTPQPTDP